MSDWSSFKDDKETFDVWREFLGESDVLDYEVELDEGFMDTMKKAGSLAARGVKGAGKLAGKKMGLIKDPSSRYKPNYSAQPDEAESGAASGGATSGSDANAGADASAGSQLPKETPLSVTKRQKGVKTGAQGQKEQPLVMQLQQMGLSQQTSQLLAKRLGQYLQQRKLKVAEAMEIIDTVLVAQNLLIEARKQKDLNPKRLSDEAKALIDMAAEQADIQPGDWKRVSKIKGLRKGSTLIAVDKDGVSRAWVYTKDNEALAQQHAQSMRTPEEEPVPDEEPVPEEEPAPREYDTSTTIKNVKGSIRSHLMKLLRDKEETKKKGSQYALGLQQVAKSGNPKKMLDFLSKRYTGWGGAEGLNDLASDDWKELMGWALKDDVVRKYAKLGYDFRQQKAQQKAAGRSTAREFGAEQTPIGKIIARFVSDNQEMLTKDPALKQLFTRDEQGNAPAFDKFAKAVRNSLGRQLKRRGYKPEEFGNILESVLRETLLESRK